MRDLRETFPEHDYYLFTPSVPGGSDDYFLDQSKFHIVTPSSLLPASLWRTSGMTRDIDRLGLDVYIGLSNELPKGIHELSVRSVVAIHDVFHKTFPEQFRSVDRFISERKYKYALKAADKIIAISSSTQAQLENYYPEARGKLNVVYQSVAPEYRNQDTVSSASSMIEPFLLFVGTLGKRKNLQAVVRAYDLLSPELRIPIKIVGREVAFTQALKKEIATKGLDDSFQFLGPTSQKTLINLYKDAEALVFPSLNEGFGRPILEALTLGTPVIAYRNSSIPEVIGNYGIIVEQSNPEALKVALQNFLTRKISVRKEGLKEHLDKFDPSLLAHLLLEIISGDK